MQVVLFDNEEAHVMRAFRFLVNSLERASETLDSWNVVFGDSSGSPVISATSLQSMKDEARLAGGTFDYFFFAENLGHGGGHNRLFGNCDDDLLLVLNPDGILAPEAISRLLSAMDSRTGVLDARQLPMEHPKEYEDSTGVTSWSSLACALTWGHLYAELGGLDHETFFMYCDDVDYSWRARLAGYEARYCPQARMFHDKRLNAEGGVIAGSTENYYSAEAALLLAYKYSRDDVLQQVRHALLQSRDPLLAQAVEEFDRRANEGLLPERLDPEHRIAEFTGGTYGSHRY